MRAGRPDQASGRTAPSFARRLGRERAALLLFGLALVLRALYLTGGLGGDLGVLESRQIPVIGDAQAYASAGLSLAQPGDTPEAGRERERAWETMAGKGPGYALFLAGCFRLFGDQPGPVRALQALLGALTCVLVFLTGRELAGPLAGGVAGLLAALHPSLILFSGRLLTEVPATFGFALGLYALLRGVRRGSAGWLALAGAAAALACLTRPTLLAAAPFLIVAGWLALGAAPRRRRAALVAVLATTLLAPLLAWNLVVRRMEAEARPVAGAAGFEIVAAVARTATLPRFRGWRTDDLDLGDLLLERRPQGWGEVLKERPFYPVLAAGNLVFYHLWFLDNLWREVPPPLQAFQRVLVLAAFGGLGFTLLAPGRLAPLWLLLLPLFAVSVKWIEIRPNIPFLPVLFLLAGVCAAEIGAALRAGARTGRDTALLASALVATLLVLLACGLLRTTPGPPLAWTSDLVAVGLVLLWGGSLVFLAARRYPARRALLAFLASGAGFVLLFASYAVVGSEPRWRAFALDLAAEPVRAVQRIDLPEPLPREAIERAAWLVDLRLPRQEARLALRLNGAPLEGAAPRRPFCGPQDQREALAREDEKRARALCYNVAMIGNLTHTLVESPQWFVFDIDPAHVAGRRRVSLALEAREGGSVTLGGARTTRTPGRMYGPSPHALTPGAGSSLYRWHVANDWRLWEETEVASLDTHSQLFASDGGELPRATRSLAHLLASGDGRWNMNLLVDLRDGTRLVY